VESEERRSMWFGFCCSVASGLSCAADEADTLFDVSLVGDPNGVDIRSSSSESSGACESGTVLRGSFTVSVS